MTNLARSPEAACLWPVSKTVSLLLCIAGLFAGSYLDGAWAREARVVLLHTSDVDGHLTPLRQRELPEHLGGLLKAAAVIEEIRREGVPTVLVDLGGLLSGSVESALTDGLLPARAAAWLRYEVRLPDPADWQSMPGWDPAMGRLLLSNAESIPRPLRLAEAVVTQHIVELDGLRIGFLGIQEMPLLTVPGLALMHGDAAERLLSARLQALRAESPQLLVLLLRTGPDAGHVRERARHWARRFPEFDVILGGGDGEAVRNAEWGRTLFSQAGRQGRWVGRVDLVYDTVRRERTTAAADLIEIGPEVEEQRDLRRLLGRELAEVARESDRVIGTNERALAGASRWPGQSGAQRLICEAIAKGVGAEVVLLEKQARAALAAGPVRVRDVFRLLPKASRLVTLELTPAELRSLLEENSALLGTPGFLGIHGMTYQYTASAETGSRINDLRFDDGSRPHGRRRLRVALHTHMLEQQGEARNVLRHLAALPETRWTDHDLDSRRLLLDYIEKHGPIEVNARAGLIVSDE